MKNKYSLRELISFIKNDASEFISIKLELLKLELMEKGSKGLSFLIYGVAILGLILFFLLFGFLALGFLISDWVDSLAGGFAIIGGIYLVILGVLFLCRKSCLQFLTNLLIKEMDPDLVHEAREQMRKRKRMGKEVYDYEK
jgi:Protein of unknown function (DUF1469).